MNGLALSLALLSLCPPPQDTPFRDGDRDLVVVDLVRRPHDPVIPTRVYAPRGQDRVQIGWAWQEQFAGPWLAVCRDRAGNDYLYPPAAVWFPKPLLRSNP